MQIPLSDALPGDLVFVHGNGFLDRLIQFGERLRWRKGSKWNHTAVLDILTPQGWTLIEATGKGVVRGDLLAGDYVVVQLPDAVDRQDCLAYARSRAGTEYGFLSVISIAIGILIPWPRVSFRAGDSTLICSALAALSLLCGGWMYPVADYYSISPAALYLILNPKG